MDLVNTALRVERVEKEKNAQKFRKPHWPPVISLEESEKRRQFRERLKRKSSLQASPSTRGSRKGQQEESSPEATPSTSQQWPPVLKNVRVSGEIFKL